MKAKVKIEGGVLEITFSEVKEDDRNRLCSIELSLLKAYTKHMHMAWSNKPEGYLVQFVRSDSDHSTAELARNVLKGYCL